MDRSGLQNFGNFRPPHTLPSGTSKPTWVRIADPKNPYTRLSKSSQQCLTWLASCFQHFIWFAETWNMQDIRAVWPCLVKPGQRHTACFETLAQLALLQATHSHIGGGHYSFSMPSGTDNSATEASPNKLFTTSWPLQLFVQLTAFWAHARNVLLQPTHVPGRNNDWADDLSRGWPDSAVALRVAYASALQALHYQAASSCVRLMGFGARNIWQLPPAACSQAIMHPNMHCDPTSPWQPGYLAASVSSLTASRSDQKRAVPEQQNARDQESAMSCDACPVRCNPHPCPGSRTTFSNPG